MSNRSAFTIRPPAETIPELVWSRFPRRLQGSSDENTLELAVYYSANKQLGDKVECGQGIGDTGLRRSRHLNRAEISPAWSYNQAYCFRN